MTRCLKLPIYYPMAYARKPAESVEDRKEENRQRQIVGLVRTTMLKRFESSWKAFQYTCEDLLLKLIAAHRTLDERRYEKWRGSNSLLLYQIEKHMNERYDHPFDAEDIEEEDLFSSSMDSRFALDKRLFKVKEIPADIEQDMNLLVIFLSTLRGLSAVHDTKVQTLLDLLKNDSLLSRYKVVVFSEFHDTARAEIFGQSHPRSHFNGYSGRGAQPAGRFSDDQLRPSLEPGSTDAAYRPCGPADEPGDRKAYQGSKARRKGVSGKNVVLELSAPSGTQ